MEFDYDILLEYLSYKGCGSYEQFKKAVNNLNYDTEVKPTTVRYTLSSLGHVEFNFEGKSTYTIAPSVVAMFHNSYKGVLAGKRTTVLLTELQKLCANLGVGYSSQKMANSPSVIILDFKDGKTLESFKNNDLGIAVSEDFSVRLMNVIPDKEAVISRSADRKNNLDVHSYKWFEYCPQEYVFKELRYDPPYVRDALYKMGESDYDAKYYLCDFDREEYCLVDKNFGIWIAQISRAAKRNRIIATYKDRKLIVNDVKAPFPELIERALTLAGGCINVNDSRKCIYGNIDIELAQLLSEKLGLEISYE